ncbi:hypothetical protein MOD48_15275 [Bacillus spizizenii]|uniref:Uncharacterized protein n=1 Tax=Bacillus spizizenii (strain ATCC 23059 / NRRL B-14472 / W23) TaxID=655816 RepID=E0TY27_BACSH|nr:hypothetical protein [Bacillus spizizenii]KFI01479.1 hypothetical protein JN25_19845 [Bacillus sp. BSC154]MDU7574690.1 hypothetical protein [Bacillus subtilis]ADM38027.1 hypothetical protein BSUW23_09915 [Bacillus spizizenii str. W23]AJW87349.1 hypothetical protein BIS30_20470 [Bacillus spizizenii]EFG93169.1 hypothetical protein BSU6633_05939 [Bacillus spizizenii ATCC 6633 = JCM 2499]
MNMAKDGDTIKVVFVYQKNEQVEKVTLNSAQLSALLNSKQVWIETFSQNLKIENIVWSYGNQNVSLQVYLK